MKGVEEKKLKKLHKVHIIHTHNKETVVIVYRQQQYGKQAKKEDYYRN